MKKKRKNVLVVLGGNSKEREISLQSGKACLKAIKKLVIVSTRQNHLQKIILKRSENSLMKIFHMVIHLNE